MDATVNARVAPIISGKTPQAGDLAPGNALVAGMRLREFEIIETLGEGGFSIVYGARDLQLMRDVAIKEYIPISLAGRVASTTVRIRSEHNRETFEAGLNGFINEARLLAQFKHPGLVEVLQFWEENGTAYMVMPRYTGKTLRSVLKEMGGRGDEPWLRGIVAPVLDVLELLHSRNVFHRDIAPDNILIKNDGTPVLLDLGSAREVVTGLQKAITVVVKPGYAPIEQYSSDFALPQGPWTDVYAVGALLHFALTGSPPPASISRIMKDSLQPLASAGLSGYSREFLTAVDRALALQPNDRPQSIAELRELLRVTKDDKTVIALAVAEPLVVPEAPPAIEIEAVLPEPPAPREPEDERTVIVSAQEVAELVKQLAGAKAAAAAAAAAAGPTTPAAGTANVAPPPAAPNNVPAAATSTGVPAAAASQIAPAGAVPAGAPAVASNAAPVSPAPSLIAVAAAAAVPPAAVEPVSIPPSPATAPDAGVAALLADLPPLDDVLASVEASSGLPGGASAAGPSAAFGQAAFAAAPADAAALAAVSAASSLLAPAPAVAAPAQPALPEPVAAVAPPATPEPLAAFVAPAIPEPVAPLAPPAIAEPVAGFAESVAPTVFAAPVAEVPAVPAVAAVAAAPEPARAFVIDAAALSLAEPAPLAPPPAVAAAPVPVPEFTLEPMVVAEEPASAEPQVVSEFRFEAELASKAAPAVPPTAASAAAAPSASAATPPAATPAADPDATMAMPLPRQLVEAAQNAARSEAARHETPKPETPKPEARRTPPPVAPAQLASRPQAATPPPASAPRPAAPANDATVVLSAPDAQALARALGSGTPAAKDSASALDLDPLAAPTQQPKVESNSFPEMEELLSGRLAPEARPVAVPAIRTPPAGAATETAAAGAAAPNRGWVIPTVIAACLAVVAVLSFAAWRLLSGPSEAPVPPPVAAETTPAVPAVTAGTDPAASAPSADAGSQAGVADTGAAPAAADTNAVASAAPDPNAVAADPNAPAPGTGAGAVAPAAADPSAPPLADASQVLGTQPPPAEVTSAALESPGQTLPVTPPPAAEPPPAAVAAQPAAPAEPAPAVASADTVKTVDVTGANPRRDSESSSRPRETASTARSRRDAKPAAASVGNVKLSIQPWGEVWINGSLRGVSPPLRFLQLEPGTYNVELRNPGLQSLRRQLTVTAGQPTSIEHRFQPAGSGAAQ
ncbi:serine/threonine-protein kinase [Tahibacter harae]|uniref:Protein kinase n=1 Tax=Tahibacter harae TaxID=2963937 RepID=A0ABT1QYD1_9GAMM|nr:serine/threonine-protein kinase [Tahibacter harae]MCQ4167283.1 protein kinase [Tahibacter harae]